DLAGPDRLHSPVREAGLMMARRALGRLALGASVLLAAGLAGCTDGPPENGPLQVTELGEERYPLEVKSRVQASPLVISETAGITPGEQAQLDAFIADYLAA